MKPRIIAHRCNLDGPSENENTISSMIDCIDKGFLVEIDIRGINGNFHIGHDYPKEQIKLETLLKYAPHLFIHCKNLTALLHLRGYNNLNVFGHSADDFVLTSQGDIFCSVGVVEEGCICVMPELYASSRSRLLSIDRMVKCKHILTDFANSYKYEIDNYGIGKQQ